MSTPNKYKPHQNKREMNRRLEQIGKEPMHGIVTYTYVNEIQTKETNDEQ